MIPVAAATDNEERAIVYRLVSRPRCGRNGWGRPSRKQARLPSGIAPRASRLVTTKAVTGWQRCSYRAVSVEHKIVTFVSHPSISCRSEKSADCGRTARLHGMQRLRSERSTAKLI